MMAGAIVNTDDADVRHDPATRSKTFTVHGEKALRPILDMLLRDNEKFVLSADAGREAYNITVPEEYPVSVLLLSVIQILVGGVR